MTEKAVCSDCGWTNVSLINIGEPGKPRMVCQGCIKRVMNPSEAISKTFLDELSHLINKHSIENVVDMPDYILAGMLCRMIEAMGPSIKKNLDWHGCNSVCHPKESK